MRSVSSDELSDTLDAAPSLWSAAVVLLEAWTDARPAHPARFDNGDRRARWAKLANAAKRHFARRPNGALLPDDRAQIERWRRFYGSQLGPDALDASETGGGRRQRDGGQRALRARHVQARGAIDRYRSSMTSL